MTAVHTAPYRIRAPIVRDVPAGQCGTENGVVVYAALIMAQENLPRPYHRKERPFWKSASANRPGPGFRTAKSESDSRRGRTSGAAERQRDVADIEAAETPDEGLPSRLAPERGCLRQQTGVEMARLRSKRRGPGIRPGTRTPLNGLTKKCSSEHRRGRGTLQCKVGKRLPEGPHKRRGGAAARCRRHRSSGDARRRHRRSRLAPERGCLRQQTGVEMARLRSKRRGPGICPAQGHR